MLKAQCCSHCRGEIPETHLKAGYVRPGPAGLLCTLCLSSQRASVWTVPQQTLNLRRAAWALSGLSLGAVAVWLMHREDFGSLGVGLFLLAASGGLMLYKVGEAELL